MHFCGCLCSCARFAPQVFEEAFDTLMIVNVLEHVNNGIRILRNLHNALKPGGLLIFNDVRVSSSDTVSKRYC
jgi:2-polyprenyl-3-methyl-5-hydroxy-6-metoxy-1,4-benzoquinol methylase